MDIVKLRDKLNREFTNLDNQFGYIVYCFDNSSDGQGTGFHQNADAGDAMVAIERIAEQFNIDLDILAIAAKED